VAEILIFDGFRERGVEVKLIDNGIVRMYVLEVKTK
jgi:hypothetical protein